MKRKIFFVVLVVITGLVALQSCSKTDSIKPKEYFAFTEPAIVAPVNEATIHITGTTADLTWLSSSESGAPLKADVYFGTDPEPPLYKAGHSALTLTVPVIKGQTYYWSVSMIDANGIHTPGPVWSFTVFEPIGIFVGDYTADEPAEAYTYDVSFDKAGDNLLHTANYWNSGWDATFTLDFTANTYDMPLTTWGTYSAIESGTIDPATGTIVGNYIIYHNGVSVEEGVHTYTKK